MQAPCSKGDCGKRGCLKAGGKNATFMKRSTPLNCVVRPVSAISPPLYARRNPLFLLLPCLPAVKYPAITATSLVPFRKEVVRGETRHSMLKTVVRSCLSNFDNKVGNDFQPRWQKIWRRQIQKFKIATMCAHFHELYRTPCGVHLPAGVEKGDFKAVETRWVAMWQSE